MLYQLILAAFLAACLLFHAPYFGRVERNLLPDTVSSSFFYAGAQIINDGKLKELFNVETQDAYQAKLDVPQLDWRLPFNLTA